MRCHASVLVALLAAVGSGCLDSAPPRRSAPAPTGRDAGPREQAAPAPHLAREPGARSPCQTAGDCQISRACLCPEPLLATEDPHACAVPTTGHATRHLCFDSYGAPGAAFALCDGGECRAFGGRVCASYETSPGRGLDVELFCASDADCEVTTRFNPCGCEQAAGRTLEYSHARVWSAELMAEVWSTAADYCGERGECVCPPPARGAVCRRSRCELVY